MWTDKGDGTAAAGENADDPVDGDEEKEEDEEVEEYVVEEMYSGGGIATVSDFVHCGYTCAAPTSGADEVDEPAEESDEEEEKRVGKVIGGTLRGDEELLLASVAIPGAGGTP